MSHVTESIFDGKTHVIPLADVTFLSIHGRELGRHPYPDLEPRIGVHLKSSSPHTPALYLYGDEIDAFTRAWCRYRHELENPPAKIDVQIEPSLTKAQSQALISMITPIGCSLNQQQKPDLFAGGNFEAFRQFWRSIQGKPAPTIEGSAHTWLDLFEHFLAYTGFAADPKDVQTKLWIAYAHGANVNDADEELFALKVKAKPFPACLSKGDVLRWDGESCNFYTQGKRYVVERAFSSDRYYLSDDKSGNHSWTLTGIMKQFRFLHGAPETKSDDHNQEGA